MIRKSAATAALSIAVLMGMAAPAMATETAPATEQTQETEDSNGYAGLWGLLGLAGLLKKNKNNHTHDTGSIRVDGTNTSGH